jgi:eukaryotic-like serine/threonine-protein kinase
MTQFAQPSSSDTHGVSDIAVSREFLAGRLSTFNRLGFLISVALVAVMNLVLRSRYVDRWQDLLSCPANMASIAAVLGFAGMWLLVARCNLSFAALRRLDAVGTVFVCLVTVIRGCVPDLMEHTEFTSVLAITNVLVFRAVVIPSRPLRTLWIGVAAVAPLALVVLAEQFRDHLPGAPETLMGEYGLFFAMWGGVAVTVSTGASVTVYGLRRQVSHARKLGQYTLEEKLGEGGMGEVYRASHAMLRRPTAIKLLRPDRVDEPALRRFEREVQQTARLTHPNTIAIYDYGHTPDHVFYYAMEFLDGLDLQTLVEQYGPQHPGRVVRILRQVASSLAEAHRLGLVHRDVKPANVVLCERGGIQDWVKVVDFGLVKDLSAEGRLDESHTSGLTGTPLYIAPESIRDPDKVDARSDLYALGAVGYFLLCGDVVFPAKTIGQIVGAHLTTSPVPPSVRLGEPLPKCVEATLLRCLAKEPADRPQTADELVELLDGCIESTSWTQKDAKAWWAEHDDAESARRAAAQAAMSTPQTTVLAVSVDGGR